MQISRSVQPGSAYVLHSLELCCDYGAKKDTSKSYQHIKSKDLIATITTDVNMQDARNGASVHSLQHRALTIQEAKGIQGYRDHKRIIGTLGERWKILGNRVDRKVSFAMGLAL